MCQVKQCTHYKHFVNDIWWVKYGHNLFWLNVTRHFESYNLETAISDIIVPICIESFEKFQQKVKLPSVGIEQLMV